MKLPVVAVVLLLLSTPIAARADTNGSITVGGVTRTYVLHVPAHLASPARLILAFQSTGLDALSDRYGFVVAYPDGLNGTWNDGIPGGAKTDDVGFARALITRLSAQYHVKPEHIFATGMSTGAIFLYSLACDRPAPVAAIAPVAGTMPENVFNACIVVSDLSVIEIGGTADPIAPKRGKLLSFDASIGFFAQNSYCDMDPPGVSLPQIAPPDGTRVKRYVYRHCAPGTAYVGYAILGGHGAASNQLNASLEIVKFFMAIAP